ncbi:uncharacterized protein LOC120458695 [Drosophila santomea]|uniref:uncharacterized protein LOC120458695 n=1 Tax=Drosophila santomea TaxID=129105 RepID=UPI00195477A0|nr:uncharacterized protein LOC120458695 [Drosophila santomea]
MCCLLEHLFKIVVYIFTVFMNFLLIAYLVIHIYKIYSIFGSVFTPGIDHYYSLWTLQSWCGTLMVVIKIKDLCYLHWWLLMTSSFILAGLVLHLILFDFQGEQLGATEKVLNFFGLGLMLASLLTVASYSRTLRPPEDSVFLSRATI